MANPHHRQAADEREGDTSLSDAGDTDWANGVAAADRLHRRRTATWTRSQKEFATMSRDLPRGQVYKVGDSAPIDDWHSRAFRMLNRAGTVALARKTHRPASSDTRSAATVEVSGERANTTSPSPVAATRLQVALLAPFVCWSQLQSVHGSSRLRGCDSYRFHRTVCSCPERSRCPALVGEREAEWASRFSG